MIDIKLNHRVIKPFFTRIADEILDKRLKKVIKKKQAYQLLACEVKFYVALENTLHSLIRKQPHALARRFDTWLLKHEEYMVYASGSLPKFERHLKLDGPSAYHLEWSKHTSKSKGCKCAFCMVSARAETVFNWAAFTAAVKPAVSMANEFVRAVGFVVCPYCSRNHIAPISDTTGNIYQPDLDHYFARSLYPYFGLCPYNLVPSCSACNMRIKNAADFLGKGYFHPYVDKVPDNLFAMEGDAIVTGEKIDASSIRIRLNTTGCSKTALSAEFFKLTAAYQVHAPEVANFVASLRHYPDRLIEGMSDQLGAAPNVLKLMLSRSIAEDRFEYKRRPLGKLYRDLYLFGGHMP